MKTVQFVMTGPPSAEVGSFVQIVNESGEPVDVGFWQHDGQNWRYIMPVRMVPELMVPHGQIVEDGLALATARITGPLGGVSVPSRTPTRQSEDIDQGIAGRNALREKLRERVKQSQSSSTSPAPPAPANWPVAPCCAKPFDPSSALVDCGHCGEGKCPECMPDALRGCLDCQALEAGKEENEFSGSSGAAAPSASRLFDGQYHPDPKKAQQAKDAGELAEDEDE